MLPTIRKKLRMDVRLCNNGDIVVIIIITTII